MQKAIIEGPAQVDTTQVLRRFRVVYSAIRTHFQTVEKQVGLGGAQVWALSVVRDNPIRRLSETIPLA